MAIRDYQKLSNFEINKQVAIALGCPVESDKATEYEQVGDTLCFYDEKRTIHSLF